MSIWDTSTLNQVFVSVFFYLFVSGISAKIQGEWETPFISVYIASQLLFHKSG